MNRSIEWDRPSHGMATASDDEKEPVWAQNLLAFQTNFMHIKQQYRSKNSRDGCSGRI